MKSAELLLGFYGDDFTGSTDAMEALARSGLRTVLFIGRPRKEALAKYAGLRAVGIAGCSRSLSPEEMDVELGQAFTALKDLNLPIVHYKVCSTFDSSPEIGSIGRAIDIGAEIFATPVVPLQVGAPALGRFCVFGNLFARSGQDSEPYRLDRHPTMCRHPTTPMIESDLRVHLARQTRRSIELLDVLSLVDVGSASGAYRRLVHRGAQVVLIDVLSAEHEPVIGAILEEQASSNATLFVAGSSGVEYSLTACWRRQGRLPRPLPIAPPAPAEGLLVVSGSCSPVTERQIAHAIEGGAKEIAVPTPELADPRTAAGAIENAVENVLEAYTPGETVICHTARGPADPRRAATRERFASMDQDARRHSAKVLGEALGSIVSRVLVRLGPMRTVVTGGDTSFFVARGLGIESLEMVAPLSPGAPLCRASIPGSPLDGLEMCFKGGQVGKDDFFERVRDPHAARQPAAVREVS